MGEKIETGQEVAKVCWTPTTKNHSKNAPVFRYIATRETVNIQGNIDGDGQLTFLTSEYIENKLHLEQMKGKTYKIFGLVTNREESQSELFEMMESARQKIINIGSVLLGRMSPPGVLSASDSS